MDDVDEVEWVEEYHGQQFPLFSGTKRKARSKKMVFLGWGSKPLIEFLESIGQDTSQQISRYDVTDIISKYVNDKNLLNPKKKKRIDCDEWLHSIFGRKSISRIKIYDLLEAHYAENQDESDDDILFSSDEDKGFDGNEQQKSVISERKTPLKKRVVETPKSCFAAIIPENIKLIYLKRSLVQDLLKDAANFERKIVGSFVRIRSDPMDYLQKLPHQLVQVKGVKGTSGTNDESTEVLLQVSNIVKDIPISALSEDNFLKDECEDLHQKVKDGLFKRLTVVELQEKALMLHEDITKHWLVTEIAVLQKRIDRANEKGWRRELVEYLERRQLLQSPDEQARILQEAPKVIAEELEVEAGPQDKPVDEVEEEAVPQDKSADVPEAVAQDKPHSAKKGTNASPASITSGVSEFLIPDTAVTGTLLSFGSVSTTSPGIRNALLEPRRTTIVDNWVFNPGQAPSDPPTQSKSQGNIVLTPVNTKENETTLKTKDPEVIELSDDEENQTQENRNTVCDMQSLQWHYTDPLGNIQGPFSVASLKRWWDAEYFPLDFKVWEVGKSPYQAVFLIDLLRSVFPK